MLFLFLALLLFCSGVCCRMSFCSSLVGGCVDFSTSGTPPFSAPASYMSAHLMFSLVSLGCLCWPGCRAYLAFSISDRGMLVSSRVSVVALSSSDSCCVYCAPSLSVSWLVFSRWAFSESGALLLRPKHTYCRCSSSPAGHREVLWNSWHFSRMFLVEVLVGILASV